MAPTATTTTRPARTAMRATATATATASAIAWCALSLVTLAATGASADDITPYFEPNIVFNYWVPDTARFLRYKSGDNIYERNSTTQWYTRMDPFQTMEDKTAATGVRVWGGGTTEHQADAIKAPNSLMFVFVGTRAKVVGYAKGFVRGNASETSEGAPDISMQLNYAAFKAADIVNLNFTAASFAQQGIDTGNLTFDKHAARLVLPPGDTGGLFGVKGIDITTGLKSEATSLDKVPIHTEYAVVNGSANPRWAMTSGTWSVESPFEAAFQLAKVEPYRSYTHLNGQGSLSQVVINVPQNTSFIVVNGTSGPNQGTYDVSFSPPAMLSPAYANQATGIASAEWTSPVLLAVTPLNPTVKYTLLITGDRNTTPNDLAIHSVTYYGGVLNGFPILEQTHAPMLEAPKNGTGTKTVTATNTNAAPSSTNANSNPDTAKSEGKKTNAGAVAGGVVGGLVAAGIIAGILFWFYRRRKRTVHREDPAEFVVDDTLDPNTLDPYPPPPLPSKKGMAMRDTPHVTRGGFVTSRSPESSDGYTSEQLGISSPSSEGSHGYLLSPHVGQQGSPDANGKWTVEADQARRAGAGGAPISPTTLLSPAVGAGGPSMATFSAFPAGASQAIPPGMASSPLARTGRTPRRARHGHGAARIHQEADGGSIHPPGAEAESESDDDVVIVPPSYDPAWRKPKVKGPRASWKNEHALRLKTDIVSQIP